MFYLSYSLHLYLINVFILILCTYIAKPNLTYINPQLNNKKNGITIFFLLYTINSVFAFWAADTFHSWVGFIESSKYINFERWEYEGIYNWLANATNNDFFIWRAIIWIPACLFMYYTAKLLNIQNRNLLVSMLMFGFFLSNTRGMLGHTMMLFGAILAFDNNAKYKKFIGLILVGVSFFFHKSMYINIIFAILALYPLGKKSITISLIAFPFLTLVASYFVSIISSGAIDVSMGEASGGIGDRTVDYASGQKAVANALGMFSFFKNIIPQYLALIYLYKKIIVENLFPKKNIFRYLFQLTYVSFYIASLFYFVDTSSFIYSRFKYMGLFPMVFVLGKVISMELRTPKLLKWIIILQGFAILYNTAYKLYKW